jgi:hypothetical protein
MFFSFLGPWAENLGSPRTILHYVREKVNEEFPGAASALLSSILFEIAAVVSDL